MIHPVLKEAVERYGIDKQMTVAIEEMSELTKALCKFCRGNHSFGVTDNIAEEIADVRIMLNQIEEYFALEDDVQEWTRYKILRLHERLIDEE